MHQKMWEKIESFKICYSVVVVDAALIFEWGIEEEFDLIITITSKEDLIRRMAKELVKLRESSLRKIKK